MKRPQAIRPEDVSAVFDDARIEALARVCKLPWAADMEVFTREVRRAASIYAADARAPNANEVHREIAALHKAASLRRYERVADLLTSLSPAARDILTAANAGAGAGITFPGPDELRDAATREDARDAVERLCAFGGGAVASRKRPNGRRSRTWKPVLCAPPASRHFDKRKAERDLVTNLRLAVLEATGRPAARTARVVRKGEGATMISGPFARMVADCLRLVGAAHVDAVGLINEVERRRRAVEARMRSRVGSRSAMAC
jgi:hypothetical protein